MLAADQSEGCGMTRALAPVVVASIVFNGFGCASSPGGGADAIPGPRDAQEVFENAQRAGFVGGGDWLGNDDEAAATRWVRRTVKATTRSEKTALPNEVEIAYFADDLNDPARVVVETRLYDPIHRRRQVMGDFREAVGMVMTTQPPGTARAIDDARDWSGGDWVMTRTELGNAPRGFIVRLEWRDD